LLIILLLRTLPFGFLHLIEGTANLDAPIEGVDVDHRSPHVLVAQQLLHRSDIPSTTLRVNSASVQKVGGKTVAQGAATHGLGDPCSLRGLSERLLGPAPAQMMAAGDAGTWVAGEITGRKEILPAPGARIFVFQRRGEIDGTIAAFQILPLDDLDVAELLSEGLSKAGRQHRDVIKRAFAGNPALAGTHRDLTMIDIEIADAQAQRLNEPQAGAIEQPDD